MSGSLLNKGSTILHALAFTVALAIISGYLPIQLVSFEQLQSVLQLNLKLESLQE